MDGLPSQAGLLVPRNLQMQVGRLDGRELNILQPIQRGRGGGGGCGGVQEQSGNLGEKAGKCGVHLVGREPRRRQQSLLHPDRDNI